MFAKVFQQILDSSIAEDWRVRHVFEDFLKLSDAKGDVDMTPQSIARRTNTPIDIVTLGISELEKPDPTSRTPDAGGRRIVRLDEHRNWGWHIVNHAKYRQSASKDMLRMSEAERKAEYRKRKGFSPRPPLKTKEEDTEAEAEPSRHVPKVSGTCPGQKPAPLPLPQVFDAWNTLGVVPKCLVVSDKRRRLLEVRLREPFFSQNWTKAMEAIKTSKFCQGENDRGWKASFDWFLQPDTCAKLIEGKYERTTTYQRPAPENSRNAHTCKPVTDYAEAARLRQRVQAAERAARNGEVQMVGQMAQDGSSPPPVA